MSIHDPNECACGIKVVSGEEIAQDERTDEITFGLRWRRRRGGRGTLVQVPFGLVGEVVGGRIGMGIGEG